MRKMINLLLLLTLGLTGGPLIAQDLEWYLEGAREAIEEERYERAVSLLREGQQRYPDELVLYEELGDLYYSKDLYNLALGEYRKAKKLSYSDYYILYRIADSLGRLNRDDESVESLEELHRMYPGEVDVVGDLGWMYFKTSRLEEGEKLLKDALNTWEGNRTLAMTLGTVYSGMYEYNLSKQYYLESIENALDDGKQYFASIACYNLSLLEHGFYQYSNALEYTNRSLELSERAPGHIARGELYKARLEYTQALEEYKRAFSLDSTPLSKVNLGDLFLEFGKLEGALKVIEEVRNLQDTSWMYYFGVNPRRHERELHGILKDVYKGLYRREKVTIHKNIFSRISGIVRGIRYRIKEWYHRSRYESLSIAEGREELAQGNKLDGWWFLFKGCENHPSMALDYLLLARDLEEPIAPESHPFYLYEEGKLTSRPELIEEALSLFHPQWEASISAKALLALAEIYREKGMEGEKRRVLSSLYLLNPGALPQGGFGVPLILKGEVSREMRRYLASAGCAPVDDPATQGYRIILSIEDDQFTVEDRQGGRVLINGEISGSPFDRAEELLKILYAVN
ncbi:MAG: tetratricopeptide repeat protein [Spirochaetales bacterium]|nr:tetratricopeptide repeat protein [Spirochaetales bacterium]